MARFLWRQYSLIPNKLLLEAFFLFFLHTSVLPVYANQQFWLFLYTVHMPGIYISAIHCYSDNYVVRNSLKNFSTDLYIQTQLSSLRLDDCPSIVPCWRSSFWGPDDVTCSNSSEPRHLDNFTCSNSSEPTHRDNVTCSNSSEAGLLHVVSIAPQTTIHLVVVVLEQV